ncbi:transmembrane protein 272-like [Sebastes umbrosus]|uniref:transmembrane protein 272-like n=1 Tax=Sebastes umbrosus TaxID=72105 RepID=UPI0018A09193|nr:transmembrane protein 272-like [Sebastes umbrosus]
MAAPSTGRPVTVTVGAILRLQLKPPPPRPPRLSVAFTVVRAVQLLAQVIFGVVYFKDCPQQPNIPNYLLGMAFVRLLMVPFVTLPCESDAAQPQEHPRGFKACLLCLISLFFFTWILAGDVWVFSVYQPNYDPEAADGLYCNKTLYTFAFWNAVWETFVVCVFLSRLCKGLLCYVMMSPAPTDRDFYGNV